MTFRSDHDAAVARADALQAEVERARARADGLGHELAEVEDERRQVEVELAATKPAPRAVTANLLALLVLAVSVVGLMLAYRERCAGQTSRPCAAGGSCGGS